MKRDFFSSKFHLHVLWLSFEIKKYASVLKNDIYETQLISFRYMLYEIIMKKR